MADYNAHESRCLDCLAWQDLLAGRNSEQRLMGYIPVFSGSCDFDNIVRFDFVVFQYMRQFFRIGGLDFLYLTVLFVCHSEHVCHAFIVYLHKIYSRFCA